MNPCKRKSKEERQSPRRMSMTSPQPASDTSVAVAEEGKSDEAPKTNTPNKVGLDATQKLWSSPPPQ